jgi:HPt (histidine-containing phosphotransfer) domain-containing protein
MAECFRTHGPRHVASVAPRSGSGAAGDLSVTSDRAEPFSKDESALLVSDLTGDLDLADVLEEFISEIPARARAIEQARIEGDVDTLIRLAHQLKGTAGGYGFPSITEEAANLERISRRGGSREELSGAVRSLTDLCQRTQPRGAASQPSQPAPSPVSTA